MRVYLIQVMEVGLSGPLDPAPRPVGTALEQTPESAPLATILIAVLVITPPLKHVTKEIAMVSIVFLTVMAVIISYLIVYRFVLY